jgi:outer membrane protein OmpA-like peptidoglycan-associated protein
VTSSTTRAAVLVLAATLGTAAVGCAKHRAAAPPPPPPEPPGLVVLLPDPDDGSIGRVVVSTPTGSVELSGAFEATKLTANQPPGPVATMDKADVDRMFQRVLSGLPQRPRHFTIYFESGGNDLTEPSRALLPDILEAVRTRPVVDVIVVGHTDTVGTAASNYELGLRRAAIVRDLLVSAGVPAPAVQVTSHGERDPLVPTADETSEPRNRRVEVDIQ